MPRPNVYVTRLIPEEGLALLRASCDVEVSPHDRPLTHAELLSAVRGRDGVVCLLTDRIDGEVMDAAKGVKGFANCAVGYDNLDLRAATERGLPLSNTPGVLTLAAAEMAWALLFAAARRVVESDRVMRSGAWSGWGPLQFIGGDVSGRTLGVVGAGRIGTAMGLMSKGFNMEVLYCDGEPNAALEKELGARRVAFEELLRRSDFVSVHVPLTPATRHLFNAGTLALMKPAAYLINTSRGPVVDEAALVDALRRGVIAGAGLDVYEFEPAMAPGLAELPNVVTSPHTASATRSSRSGMAVKAARNLLAMLAGERPPDCLNPGIYSAPR